MRIGQLSNAAFLAATLGVFSLAGCASVPNSHLADDCAARAGCCRDNVYVIFVDSPFDICRLAGVPKIADSFKEMGFNNTLWFDYHTHGDDDVLADWIRDIKGKQPDSRIMLVGYSTACLMVEDAIERVNEDGIWIDSAAYLDSYWYRELRDSDRPQNSGRSMLIYRSGTVLPVGFPNVEAHSVPETNHFKAPCNPYCYDALLAEAIRLADGPCACPCHHESATADSTIEDGLDATAANDVERKENSEVAGKVQIHVLAPAPASADQL